MTTKSRAHRVLIVDDDADWRHLLHLVVEDLGYETAQARSGEEALQMIEEEEFSLILLDLRMPGMDGRELLRRLPEPGPRVVLLTAADPTEAGEALNSGPHYYLPKAAGTEALSLILDSLQAS
jgi:two-component system, chemotaxis family, chemotaxis protein CheY